MEDLMHSYRMIKLKEVKLKKNILKGTTCSRVHEDIDIDNLYKNIYKPMHSIVTNIQWRMELNQEKNIYDAYISSTDLPLDEDTWNIILYPHGSWILTMAFDSRAFGNSLLDDHIQFNREIIFLSSSTLRDVFNKVAKGPCYGFFEGIKPCPLLSSYQNVHFDQLLPTFRFVCGT